MRENSVEATSKREAERRGCWAVKLRFVIGGGWPDHTIFAPGGRIAFIEFKRPVGGRWEPGQKFVLKTLKKLGFRVAMCNTPEKVKAFYKEWLD